MIALAVFLVLAVMIVGLAWNGLRSTPSEDEELEAHRVVMTELEAEDI